jgi:hypothetical protein
MENAEYVRIFTGDKDVAKKLLQTMIKYGEDKWWVSENSDYMTYKQFQEDMMLIESEAWQKSTEKLLDRKITFLEFQLTFSILKDEVIRAYKSKYGV